MVGLGRMGSNIVRRLLPAGHECVVYDVNADSVKALSVEGVTPAGSLAELVQLLDKPRAVWVMVPSGQITEQTVSELGALVDAGDVIIDGGNSYYRDDIARAKTLSNKGIHYVDVGTSGGVWGLERGYSLMIGGEGDVVERLAPLFAAIAPAGDAAPRPPRPPRAPAGPPRPPRQRRARLPALRAKRRRTLRQDGPQRHRVRRDGRLRRGAEHSQARQRRHGDPRGRR
jgi:6-phosphogluconate dehydrogenase